jgi:hypothetical protein
MSVETSANNGPSLGLLLIASFWFLVGSFALVLFFILVHSYPGIMRDPLWMVLGLGVSLGFLFEGWGLVLARSWAIVVGFILAALLGAFSFSIFWAMIASLISNGYIGQPLLIVLPVLSLPILCVGMVFYLIWVEFNHPESLFPKY